MTSAASINAQRVKQAELARLRGDVPATVRHVQAATAQLALADADQNVDFDDWLHLAREVLPLAPQSVPAVLMAAQQQQGEPQQDPNMVLAQAEQMKAQASMQSDMAKLQLEQQKLAMEDDRKRDQMDQDLLVDAAKVLGQYGTQVDVAAIKAAQQAARG